MHYVCSQMNSALSCVPYHNTNYQRAYVQAGFTSILTTNRFRASHFENVDRLLVVADRHCSACFADPSYARLHRKDLIDLILALTTKIYKTNENAATKNKRKKEIECRLTYLCKVLDINKNKNADFYNYLNTKKTPHEEENVDDCEWMLKPSY